MWEKPSFEVIQLGCEITAYLCSDSNSCKETD